MVEPSYLYRMGHTGSQLKSKGGLYIYIIFLGRGLTAGLPLNWAKATPNAVDKTRFHQQFPDMAKNEAAKMLSSCLLIWVVFLDM